jgi:DoxX-like family
MFAAYVMITVLAAAANTYAATHDFTRPQWLLTNMSKLGVPDSWLTPLGILKAAGALGLLVGIGVPWIGTAAAVGLTLFFVGALFTHRTRCSQENDQLLRQGCERADSRLLVCFKPTLLKQNLEARLRSEAIPLGVDRQEEQMDITR